MKRETRRFEDGFMPRGMCFFDKGDSPDMSGVNKAAEVNAELGKEALDWYKTQYYEQAPEREAAAKRAQEVSDSLKTAMDTQTSIAADYDAYGKRVFRPLEEGIVKDATNFNTEGERERRAGLAGADIAQAFGAARSQGFRDLGRMGINPADGRMTGALRELAASEALGTGFAKNKSRADSETLGRALKMDAAGLGRNLPSNQTAAATTAINAGNSSAANGLTPVQIAQSGTGQVGQGFQTAGNLNTASGNLYGNVASMQNQANQSSNSLWSGLGSAAGALGAAWMLSDVNAKENIEPVDPQAALEQVVATPVANSTYKPGTSADDGGVPHTGPMAQDVKRNMGSKAAPKGKMIDLISLNGINMAAIQGLNAKVDRMAAALGVPA
jgi:hypothetical protein